MSKKIQLTIPKPCHENWDNMSSVQQGKFCGSCQKQVVDFISMSDRQVAEFFKKPSTGSVCGRFMTDQLDRSIEIPKKRIPWLKYFFQFVIPAFLFSIKASSQKTKGRIAITKVTKDTTKIPILMGKIARPVCTTPLMGDVEFIPEEITKPAGIIQLLVVDVKGNPIPYASIETGVIGKGGVTNKNGVFRLDRSILNMNGHVFVSSAGYERKDVPVKTISVAGQDLTIVLQEKGWLNETIVTPICHPRQHVTLGAVSWVDASQLIEKKVIGKVTDEFGKPIPNASIIIKGTSQGVMTDANGLFTLTPVKGWDQITLVGSSIGYDVAEESVYKEMASDTVRIQLRSSRTMMVGELVVCHKPPVKKELKKAPLIPVITDDKHTAAFRVFPNPVEPGASLNIEWKQTEEGYFTIQLLDQSGQSVHQQDIWIDAEARSLSIDIPQVARGSYLVTISSKMTGKKFTEKVIIQ
jgi:hypothetical protein